MAVDVVGEGVGAAVGAVGDVGARVKVGEPVGGNVSAKQIEKP